MRSFLKFNRGVLRMPFVWQVWLVLLVTLNLVAPLFFLGRWEAQVVLATMLASVVLMTYLTGRFGFTRILGLGHILWLPMLGYLWLRLDQIPSDDAFGVWIRVLMVLNSISLLIDAVDVLRYRAGDRAETVPGL